MITLSGTLLGSVATYTCNSGYKVQGDATVVCQANAAGAWSGTTNCVGVCIGEAGILSFLAMNFQCS